MISKAEVVATARQWIGTPFREMCWTPGPQGGTDCVGLNIGVGIQLMLLPDNFAITYKQSPDNGRMVRECEKYLRRIPVLEMQPGDVVLIQTVREPHHMGILVDYKWGGFGIVHALKARGKVVEHRLDPEWRDSIVAAYSYPSVA